MAHLDEIQPQLLTRVAREIGESIDKKSKTKQKGPPNASEGPATDAATPLELGETLTVWKFQKKTFETLAHSKLSGDLSDWLEQTGALYHQIRLRKKPAGFARSHRLEEGKKRAVFQFGASPLASRLNEFFEKIDQNEEHDPFLAKDPVVRLLEIPPFHVSALWLFLESQRESRVLIIHAPKRYQGLYEGAMVNSEQFFEALSAGPIIDVMEFSKEVEGKVAHSERPDESNKSTSARKVTNRMSAKRDVEGKMGDVSGSGVGGKIGDVSGLPVGGKIGDVSGSATFEQIQDLVLNDRSVVSIECLEARVNRLEYEVLSIARWLDLRMRALEENVKTDILRFQGKLGEQADDIADLEDRVEDLEPDK